jgi:transposase
MPREILSEAHWRLVEPCLPPTPHRRRVPGPQPIADRSVLTGILFVLKTGLPWEELPAELGAGSGMTCLRRLRRWQKEGVWRRIRRALVEAIDAREIDWKRAEIPPRRRMVRMRGQQAVEPFAARRRPRLADPGPHAEALRVRSAP